MSFLSPFDEYSGSNCYGKNDCFPLLAVKKGPRTFLDERPSRYHVWNNLNLNLAAV